MKIERLGLENFRLVRSADIELAPGANLFVGANAQGKTTLLEALSYLSTGRSFRTVRDRECLAHGADAGAVTAAQCRFRRGPVEHDLRAAITPVGKNFWVDQKPVRRLGELWGLLNTVVFIPTDLQLVHGPPAERRALLDTLLARTSAADLRTMQDYETALRQRNALLRADHPPVRELAVYEHAMALHGARLMIARERLVAELAPVAAEQLRALAGGRDEFQPTHECGFPHSGGIPALLREPTPDPAPIEERLLAAWEHDRPHDIHRHQTLHGPHRADLALRLNNRDARPYASQGQARSLVLALRLAEVRLVESLSGFAPVLLLDDVLGELDRQRAAHFVGLLADGRLQSLITAADAAAIDGVLAVQARFNVDGGGVQRIG